MAVASASVFDLLRSLDLPAGDYAIFGSGPLIVRGIIEATNDLDVLARSAAWKKAQEQGELVHLPEHDVEVVSCFDGVVTIGTRWAIGEFDVDELLDTAEIIDGLPFVRLEYVILYKQIAGRPKDMLHLELIKQAGLK